MFGPHINYHKSTLIAFGCEESQVEDIISTLRWVQLSIVYLGIPLGVNIGRVATWQPILSKIEKHLALWKAKLLSRVGRLVLIKSVLNNLPLYYLSLFKLPKFVAQRIISIQTKLF